MQNPFNGYSPGEAQLPLTETKTAPSIASGVLTLDCALGNVFVVALTETITSVVFNNVPSDAYAMTVYFIGNGTLYAITWPASVIPDGGTAPDMPSTNGTKGRVTIDTYDGGIEWQLKGAGLDFS